MNLYQDHILDHYHNPQNFGELTQATHKGSAKNPTCGDQLTFMLYFDAEKKVQDVAWVGQGCAISQASASLLSEIVVGKTKVELLDLTSEDLLELLQLPLSPARLKCGILSLEALQKALL